MGGGHSSLTSSQTLLKVNKACRKQKQAVSSWRRTSSSTLLRRTSRVSSTDTLISIKAKGSAAVAVELSPAPGLDRRVQVRASLGPVMPFPLLLLRVHFGPLLLLGRREGSPTAVLAARDCILGLLI